jgi:DNA invertase Pin-like site-specific DNA recombinase
MGRGVINILSSINSLERDQVAERTSIAMQHMRSEGLYTGGRCRYGFAVGDDGRLVEDADEQAVIAAVRGMRQIGMSMRAIVDALDERDVVGRTGRPLALPQVARLLAA